MSLLKKIANRVFPSQQATRVRPWFKVNGDKTLRLNYDLNEISVVFDLGGYEGQWASDIFSKYQCFVWVFEPFPIYAQNIQERFRLNKKIIVLECGLGNTNQSLTLYSNADASSVFNGKGDGSKIEIRKASDFIIQNGVKKIDLMKINIEGGEYDLLENLIETGIIKQVNNVQIQFHDFVPNAVHRMKNIQSALSQTHKITFQYEFVWENWKLIE